MLDKKFYVADFETTTIFDENLNDETIKNTKLEVWLAGFVDIDNIENREKYKIQTDIKRFFKELIDDIFENYVFDVVVFFHNLKFDGSYILHYFEELGIKYDTYINDMGQWYSISIEVEGYTITFRDSLKILNFSLEQIGKNVLGGKVKKGDTPLLDKKPKTIKKEWIEYIKTDLEILGKAIKGLFYGEKFTKFTSASESLKEYREITEDFKFLFPKLDELTDGVLRKGYRGGWTFCNPRFQEKLIEDEIAVYDKNSMYPAIMLNYALPYGYPKVYKGYERKEYHLYVYVIKIAFDIKENHLPCIQIKDKVTVSLLGKRTTEYLYTSDELMLDLVVTNYDLDLIQEHYNCDIEFIETYEFQCKKYMFNDYIDKFSKQKIDGKKEKNYVKTQKAKLMLNSLYGKFGSRVEQRSKTPFLDSEKVLRFMTNDVEFVPPVYLPVAMFVTSIGRYEVITDAQKNYDYFLYSDTDSIHLIKHDNIDLPVDKYEFGFWDLEYSAKKGKFLRAKLYMEQTTDDKFVIRGAGMTDEIKSQVNFDNFKIGATFKGKRATKQIKGGVLIYKTDFTIRDFNDYIGG